MNTLVRKIVLPALCLLPALSSAQKKPARIQLQHADLFEYVEGMGKQTRRLDGNVCFKHEEVLLYCDSAFLYPKINALDAYGHIRITQPGGVNVTGDSLRYDGNSRMAEIKGNIVLVHDNTELTTTALKHDLAANTSTYKTGGRIIDGENTLTSKVGIYHSQTGSVFFRNNVVLVNPDYTITADTLEYSTGDEKAIFHGPTTIKATTNTINCEAGWYDTRSDLSEFSKRASIITGKQSISGDSLSYNRTNGYGKARGNVEILDTLQKLIIRGNYSEYHEKQDIALITGEALMIDIYEDDSLFLHADTLRSALDSSGTSKMLYAYHKVRFYKPDMQGKCDSLAYSYADSTIQLYKDPVVWSKENQMSGDRIDVKRGHSGVKSLDFQNNSFIISQVDSIRFNQIKGRNMTGFFINNELNKIKVNGNGETVYYAREEDSSFVGVNLAQCSEMMIYVQHRDITGITFIKTPTAVLYPLDQINRSELALKGFRWLDTIRPRSRKDIFTWR